MLHEMVHLYCIANNIKDTSRGCTYHNKHFKEEAEKRDLIITHHERIGYSITTPSDNLINFCIEQEFEEIKVYRLDFNFIAPIGGGNRAPSPDKDGKSTPKPSSTRKYICPCCRQTVRATRDTSLICGICYNDKGEIIHLEKGAASLR